VATAGCSECNVDIYVSTCHSSFTPPKLFHSSLQLVEATSYVALNEAASELFAFTRHPILLTPNSSNVYVLKQSTPPAPNPSYYTQFDLNQLGLQHGVTSRHRRLLQHAWIRPDGYTRANHQGLSAAGAEAPPGPRRIDPGFPTARTSLRDLE
jgi:hypothetical protein